MSDNHSATDELRVQGSRGAYAAWNAAVVFGAIAGSAIVKFLLRRILGMPRNGQLRGPFILAFVLGLFWFALAFLVLLRSRSSDADSFQQQSSSLNRQRAVGKTIARAIVIACVLAISAWTGLALNDEILESRSLPWIAPLITMQEYGFAKASQRFPCQIEGSDLGCEAYKWIPTFLAANTLCYVPFVLIISFFLQHSEAFRKTVRVAAHLFARWCPVAVGAGLLALQVMHGLKLDTHDSLYPNPGVAHWHFGVWEQINDVTGTLITVAGLSLPFVFCRTIRRRNGLAGLRIRLAAATSVAATILVALILGDVY